MKVQPPSEMSASEYEDVYQNAPSGYLSTTADGIIVRVNDTLLAWTRFAREELVGRSFTSLLTLPGRIFHDTHYGPLIAIRGAAKEIAFDLVRSDGTAFPGLVNAVAYRDAAGSITKIFTTVIDATDRRAYERELLRARRVAEESTAAKEALLAMMSHEMRSPLGSIQMAAELLGDLMTDAQQERYLGIIERSTDTVLRLVNAILDRSKLDAGQVKWEAEVMALRGWLVEATEGLALKAEAKGLELVLVIDPQLPAQVLCDPLRLGQIVTNLVSNSIKFTSQGRIELALRMRSLTLDRAVIELRVTDTGIGIPAHRLAKIFDDYQQASADIERQYGGTGLGLSITRRLAALGGGTVEVESTLGRGSSFLCVLPLPLPIAARDEETG